MLVTLVFDGARQRTDVVAWTPRNLSGKPLFAARLTHHVPFLLHGTFTPRLF